MSTSNTYADKETRLFVQRSPGDAWEYLGIVVSIATESIEALNVAMEQSASRLEDMARLHRRRMWPRWAAFFTLIVAGVTCVA